MGNTQFALGARVIAIAALLVLVAAGPVAAQIPQRINYQGFLTSPVTGQPLDGPHAMTFRLYPASMGGVPLYEETQPAVPVNNGVFNAAIGAVTPIPLPFDQPYFLEIAIGGETLAPRQAVNAAPYARRAAVADDATRLEGQKLIDLDVRYVNTYEPIAADLIIGTLANATLPAVQLTGSVTTAQIAANAVTQAKLSPPGGAAPGKVLGTDGVNLQWQSDANSGGTVTQVSAGTGLTGGPITTSGSLALDTTYADGLYFRQGGNAFNAPAVLGTNDQRPLSLRVGGELGFRLQHITGQGYDAAINVIGGSPINSVSAGISGATIAGGGGSFTILPQFLNPNTVEAVFGTVGGGWGNHVLGSWGTVGGGSFNYARGNDATVSGGTGNEANGNHSMVPGGVGNIATGTASFAAGSNALAQSDGCFVWADNSGGQIGCAGANQVIMRGKGSFFFVTGGNNPDYSGAQLLTGSGAWSSFSDRAGKANVRRIDPQAVLRKVASLPIATWNWKAQPERIRHMGPMAQDFRAAFGLGEDERQINSVDADGVALAAIQGLHRLLADKDRKIRRLEAGMARLDALERELAVLKARLAGR